MVPRDLAIVGLPGVGKSSLGKRLATRLGVPYLDVDRTVVDGTGVAQDTVAAIFEREGEAGFRSRERAAIAALAAPNPPAGSIGAELGIGRVVALGGGAVSDPRNRWALRGRARLLWLDAPDALILERLAGARAVRPLFATGDPARTLARLRRERARFYATGLRLASSRSPATLVDSAIALLRADRGESTVPGTSADAVAGLGTRLLDASTASGRWVVGTGIAAPVLREILRARGATRLVVVTEARAAKAFGDALVARLARDGTEVVTVVMPSGEEAKRLGAIETAAKQLAAQRIERGDLLVAVGGGALSDAAGLLAALYLRGIDWVAIPTTLAAQVDASLGGKTAVDLDEGKNLVGAFHQPKAVLADLDALRTLPLRELAAATAEAAKIALLGEARLFELLEGAAPRIGAGDPSLHDDGTYAEIVERAGWWKCEVVRGDEREQGDRMSLNLGHTLGHALEQAAAYRNLLHGEAVGYGLRASLQIGEALGITPPALAARGRALLDALQLGTAPRRESLAAVVAALGRDKKVAAGRSRWVLAGDAGYVVRDDVPASLVEAAATAALAGTSGG